MIHRLLPVGVAMLMAGAAVAAPAPAAFVYCSAASNSPRGQGLIVTAIFSSRSDPAFVRSAFINFLRTSYAPYGNNWVFSEQGVFCPSFIDRRQAEVQRNLEVSRVPRPTQSIFPVTFEMG